MKNTSQIPDFKRSLALALLLLSFLATATALMGCQPVMLSTEEKIKPVEVIALTSETRQTAIQYYGYVLPEYVKKYAFATGGVLESVPFQPGDSVKSGDLLAKITPDKLNIAVSTAAEQEAQAKLQVQKAQTALDFLENAVADTKGLVALNVATQQQLDEVALKRDLAKKDLELAQGQLAQAKLQGKYQKQNRDDATMYSEIDGVVAQVLNKPGELVAPGYPVVIVKSLSNIVSVGMTAEDLRELAIGDKAIAQSGDVKWTATVIEISVLPDEKTRTYEVKYALSGTDQPLIGELVAIEISGDQQEGIWLPINAILNDGLDYVYVVEEGRAIRKNIELLARVEDEVSVKGLAAGDQLVVKGSSSLSHGYKVQILEGANE